MKITELKDKIVIAELANMNPIVAIRTVWKYRGK